MTVQIPALDLFELTLHANGVLVIAFNRPNRYNALNPQVYKQWGEALEWAAKEDAVKVTVMTGNGKYYSSGQELAAPEDGDDDEDPEAAMNRRYAFTTNVITQLIHFPKLIIAAINGPAIGFAVTSAALCDIVYATPEATFNTPFMKLGFCAEGGSSVIFPRVMGYSRANEMLLLGKKFTAEEMVQCGMVARTIPSDSFREQILKIASAAAKAPIEAMKATKHLIRAHDFELMDATNIREMTCLRERMMSDESAQAIMAFMMAKAAAKDKAKL
ncbi:Enoyl-CoA delta isomerase 2, mitochondrial [Actinomortierella ambigua]|uniref:Enoyl-CoA delta isomerase 2, mitochondrial n=1 Tax=Actinomortierella ambigua TaxID=1343610 RepID=A0A9P6Q527_9FUNG|nr:Enoyl-CoA delta isomerase 2, mitochondrial [Actinomortierella ambigua]